MNSNFEPNKKLNKIQLQLYNKYIEKGRKEKIDGEINEGKDGESRGRGDNNEKGRRERRDGEVNVGRDGENRGKADNVNRVEKDV